LRKLFYILIFSIIWSPSFSQGFKQGQLYAEPSEGATDIIYNTTLDISFIHVDDFVAKVNPEHFASFENMAHYLTYQFDDEKSKVRSIYISSLYMLTFPCNYYYFNLWHRNWDRCLLHQRLSRKRS
jgi:hypothetical protein